MATRKQDPNLGRGIPANDYGPGSLVHPFHGQMLQIKRIPEPINIAWEDETGRNAPIA